jgi:DNA-binding winged helix-turn-helix (wHTH) protein
MALQFGSFEIDHARRRLSNGTQAPHLTPKSFELLWLLAEAAPRVVTKAEIHAQLWPGGAVTDATLVGLVKEIRRTLHDGSANAPIIRTVHRVGYALEASITQPTSVARDGHWLIAGNRSIALKPGENIIGRDPAAEVWIDHVTISRRHARITVHATHAAIEDLGSKNGTSLHGKRLKGAVVLCSGDEFVCGQLVIAYRQTDASVPTATVMGRIS